MKRDFNVIRNIMLQIEACEDADGLNCVELEAVDEPTIGYHLSMLYDAEFIDGIVSTSMGSPFSLLGANLTWTGHEFLDNARNDEVWGKTQAFIKNTTGSVSLDVLKELLSKATVAMFS